MRAELLRYLILGGCPAYRPDERGVQLFGAYVTGTLDLSFCTTKGETDLRWCRFEEEIEAAQSRIGQLDLSGSFLPGINAQGARVTGTLFLSDGFTAKGEMLLAGAKIGGQLACVGGHFENETGNALNARGLKVKGGLFWFRVSVPQGRVDLSSAEVGDLVDDLASWPDRSANGDERLVLDGFRYDRIAGAFSMGQEKPMTDAARRLRWLARGNTRNGVFCPQPYEQLGHVLGEMGHAEDRRRVLMERERLQRRADRLAVPAHRLLGWPRRALMMLGDVLLRWGVGYGFKPWRSLYVGAGLIGIGWLVAASAWQEGSFAPNSDVIIDSPEWQLLARDPAIENPAEVWSSAVPDTAAPGVAELCTADPPPAACRQGQGMDYEAFHALAYAVDVVVPLVVLGQEATWAPSKDRGPWGHALWWLRWVLTGAGWVVAAFGAAAVTGLIRRE